MISFIWSGLVFACLALAAKGTNAIDGTLVQLFEWSWSDVATECETFLSQKGYAGVQVSPPMEHILGSQWWTRYQPVTYDLVSRSGDESQFIDMVKRCNAANVSIIVDAVINHMAAGSGTGTGGSTFSSRTFPYYSKNDFHHYDNNVNANCAVTDYTDKYNVQYCDLVGLPDLSTGSSYVQEQISAYINKMADYGIRGIRIDAAKHQDAGELQGITSRISAGLYIVQEVIGADGEAVQPDMYFGIGQVTEFYYADYLDSNVMADGNMIYLQTFGEKWGLMPTEYALIFLDNHDTQRNGRAQLTYKDGDMYAFASMFMLAWPYGTSTRVMSSYYFTDTDAGPPSVGVNGGANCMDNQNWVCEHRWTPIAGMVGWKNAARDVNMVLNWQQGNNNQIAFSRGNKAFIAMNRDSFTWTTTLETGLAVGDYCNVVKDGCEVVTVGSDGKATVSVSPLSAVAIHV